jgi:hypothetical protein
MTRPGPGSHDVDFEPIAAIRLPGCALDGPYERPLGTDLEV